MDFLASRDFNIKLIKEVEKRPCLFNNQIPDNMTRKAANTKAWKEVADALGVSDTYMCKMRWKNLRKVYSRTIKKINNGASTRPYYLTRVMSFTLPYIKSQMNEGNNDDSNIEDSNNSNIDDDVVFEIHTDEPTGYEDEETNRFGSNFNEPTVECCPLSADECGSLSNVERPSSAKSNETIAKDIKPNIKKLNKSIAKCVERNSQSNNQSEELYDSNEYRKMFLLSLLPDLSALSNTQMRNFKIKVSNLIVDMLDR